MEDEVPKCGMNSICELADWLIETFACLLTVEGWNAEICKRFTIVLI